MTHSRACCLFVALLEAAVGWGAAWPPEVDARNSITRSLDGRAIERYTHGARDSWGYPAGGEHDWDYPAAGETGAAGQNHHSSYVLTPTEPRSGAPLYVVLHSANRTAYDYLGYACLNRKIDGNDDPASVVLKPPEDFYALFLNSTNSEWWGWSQARRNMAPGVNAAPPAEKRVLDTVDWVAERYKIDRNRIYLTGASMGGCGALGIGMPNGEVFAAVRAIVPAGTGYASYRMGGFAPSPPPDASQAEREAWIRRASGAGLPDPPVVVDFSSPMDVWATTQPALVQAAQAGRLPLVLAWGPFGHSIFGSMIAKYPACARVLAFPWLEIRKNEAYPVFTRASCDQRSPWLDAPAEYDDSGQMNALFRWQNQRDEHERFVMRLWIAGETAGEPVAIPATAIAGVTFRRLQRFRIQAGRTYQWRLSRNGIAVESGKADPGIGNLLTIPRVRLTTVAAELSIEPVVR